MRVSLIEHQVVEFDREVKACPKDFVIGLFAVYRFDNDSAHRLEPSCEQMVENPEIGCEVRRVSRCENFQLLGAPPRFDDQFRSFCRRGVSCCTGPRPKPDRLP